MTTCRISLDNGLHMVDCDDLTDSEIEQCWDAIVDVMDGDLCESVHSMGLRSNREFLAEYLRRSDADLIVG